MKDRLFIFMYILILSLALNAASSFNIDKLKAEALKVVPSDFKKTDESSDENSAFIAFSKGQLSYQFTLSGDMEPQMGGAEKFDYKGKTVWFGHPMSDASGMVMIILSPEKSLVIMHVAGGFNCEKEIKKEDMIKIMDKINLEGLK